MSLPFFDLYDLVTPDGKILKIHCRSEGKCESVILIENISSRFVGFDLDPSQLIFNLKSSLAQLGITTRTLECHRHRTTGKIEVVVEWEGLTPLGKVLVKKLEPGIFVGKLFARDDRRLISDISRIESMMGRADRHGQPLFSLGKGHQSEHIHFESINQRAIAKLPLLPGQWHYKEDAIFLVDLLLEALKRPSILLRQIIRLSQHWKEEPHLIGDKGMILVRTIPLYFRFLFVEVANDLFPPHIAHTSAQILEPLKSDENQVYELFGTGQSPIEYIPLQFYSLEPFRSFFSLGDTRIQSKIIEDKKIAFDAMQTAPPNVKCATLLSNENDLHSLNSSNWHIKEYYIDYFPKPPYDHHAINLIDLYIENQPITPFLRAMEQDKINSESVLFTRYFPHPSLKQMLLGPGVRRYLKGLFFEEPSREYSIYFSHEDRALLMDLARAGIDVFWVNRTLNLLQKYVVKPSTDSGLFVPIDKIEAFCKSLTIGIYGSYLTETNAEEDLKKVLQGLMQLSKETSHLLLNPSTQFAIVSGGGPGIMRQANHIAQELGILSIGRLVDFSSSYLEAEVKEQQFNEFIEGLMTYRLDRLIERQAEFHLDLPIFMCGGYGTDFELALEELRRKVGASMMPTPMLLFGPYAYWSSKISGRFQMNRKHGTIKGTEWCSNTLYCVENAREALLVYTRFFTGMLKIGPLGPIYEEGFCHVAKQLL